MNYIDILNQHLNANYKNINEVKGLSNALSVCLKDERLYRYIPYFNETTWTDDNQELFASILGDYIKSGNYLPNIKSITNSLLLTHSYELNVWKFFYLATKQALNEENIKLALQKNSFNTFLFRENPLVLKVYLINNYENNINFNDSAWNEENAKIYLNNLLNGKVKNIIYSFYYNIINYKTAIDEHQFNILNDFYIKDKLDESVGSLLYQRMIEYPDAITAIRKSNLTGIESFYLKGLLVAQRFDLVDNAIDNNSLNEENIQILADNIELYLDVNNGKLNSYLKNNPLVLNKFITLKKYEYIDNFYDKSAWTDENIRQIYDEKLDSIFYHRFNNDANALKVYLLGNYKLDINFVDTWTDENIELYFSYLKNNNPDKIISSFANIPNYFNECLKHNVFKFLNYSRDKNVDNELLCQKLKEFPNDIFNLPIWIFDNNIELSRILVDTKRFSLLKDNLLVDEELTNKFVLYLDEYLSQGFNSIPKCFSKNLNVIKRLIELDKFDMISLYADWNIENISLIANSYIQDKLLYLDIPCRDEAYLNYALINMNVYIPNIVDYHDYSEFKDPFFSYLQENKIYDIRYLIQYYKSKNILDEYIQDGYITDKFRNVLIFNHGYQQYCFNNNIDITSDISDLSLLSYIKCSYKVSNLFKGIFINETNYQEYFDKSGPKDKLYDFLFNANSIDVFKELVDEYPNPRIEPIKIYFANKVASVNSNIRRICFNYFEKNYEYMNEQKVDDLIKIVYRLEYSNSLEMRQFQEQILEMVLSDDKPFQKMELLEKIFLQDNMPMFAKIFMCFKVLYPNFQKIDINKDDVFDFSLDSRISPNLLIADPKNERMQLYKKIVKGDKTAIRFQIVFNVLLKCAINSSNMSLINYLKLLQSGNDCITKLKNNEYDLSILNDKEIEVLNIFVSKISAIYENTNNIKINNKDIIEKCKYLIEYYKPNSKYTLADRIVRSFGYFAGIDSLDQILKMIKDAEEKTTKENEKFGRYLENNLFRLKDNDLIRCFGRFNVLDGSLENGNFCKELLGPIIGLSDSDTTPLDSDFSQVNVSDNLYESINSTPTGWGFGNLFCVLKDNYITTRDNNGNILDTLYDPMKLDVFSTKTSKGGHETHWGATIGYDSNDVLCYIHKKLARIDDNKPYNENGSVNYIENNVYDDLPFIKFLLSKKKKYTPIVDMSGKLIFTVDEYNYIRSKMMGLSYYDCSEYEIDKESLLFDGVEDLISEISQDRQRIENIRESIYKRIEEIILNPDNGLDIKKVEDLFNGDLSDGICELFETGSTSRFSNIPNDSDFDFMLKIDRKYFINPDMVNKILLILKDELKPSKLIPTVDNRFRGTGISIGDFTNLDIDISLDQRTNVNTYSSELCLNDRYNSIKQQYPDCYPYVLANVVKAKQLMKEVAYKREDGGMSGIGIENWILQNGGSLKRACKDFLIHAYNKDGSLKSFNEFKECYYVFDFGCNHEPRQKIKGVYFPYDNFIADNMNEISYTKIVKALENYMISLENQNIYNL